MQSALLIQKTAPPEGVASLAVSKNKLKLLTGETPVSPAAPNNYLTSGECRLCCRKNSFLTRATVSIAAHFKTIAKRVRLLKK
jgi:hypothetical protein